jgi:ribulose-5-phosphate 4-epimerase/fuculose-1-phosphate aldolase
MPEVKVVEAKKTIGSAEAAAVLATVLSEEESPDQIAVLKGHGPFAHGATLERAYRLISVLEHSSLIISQAQMLERMPQSDAHPQK